MPYDGKPTIDILHVWMQIVGKVKLKLTPFLNDWWNVTFAVAARGLTRLTIPFGERVFHVDVDVIDHQVKD